MKKLTLPEPCTLYSCCFCLISQHISQISLKKKKVTISSMFPQGGRTIHDPYQRLHAVPLQGREAHQTLEVGMGVDVSLPHGMELEL